MTRTISLAGTTLELLERGQGRSLLFLHAGEGLASERPWLDLLAKRYCVIAPSHPGYGNSPLIDGGAGGVDDLAYYTSISPPNWALRTRYWSAPISAAGSRPR